MIKKKIKSFVQEIKSCIDEKVEFNGMDFLQNHFIKVQSQNEKLTQDILECLDKALDSLLSSREAEGEKLILVIENHKKRFQKTFSNISPLTGVL